jgi:hypothetical protein
MQNENDKLDQFAEKLKESVGDQKNKTTDKPQKEQRKKSPFIETYFKHFKDGTLLESVFDNTEEKTNFAILNNGETSMAFEFKKEGKLYRPPPANNTLIERGFVGLPSQIGSFNNEADLLKEIRNFIHEFVQIPEEFEKIASYYVLLSWVYDEFLELPYLRVIGDYGSGKSRFLKTIGSICYRPIFANGSASVSALFRIINDIQGTLILDEADWKFSDTTSEIIKILNSGFSKGIPVLRSESKGSNAKSFDPRPFDVFCPKIIATRRPFADEALESRCLTTAMEALTREDIPHNIGENFEIKALEIRNMLLSFRFEKIKKGIQPRSLPKIKIEPRLRQIISPLYSIVDSLEAQQEILEFIEKRQKAITEDRFGSFEGEILRSYAQLFEEGNNEPLIQEITDAYNNEFGSKYPIKAKKVGNIFKQILHLKTKKIAKGFIVLACEENEKQFEKLKAKYGLENEKMNDVNLVNIEEKEEIIDIPFE